MSNKKINFISVYKIINVLSEDELALFLLFFLSLVEGNCRYLDFEATFEYYFILKKHTNLLFNCWLSKMCFVNSLRSYVLRCSKVTKWALPSTFLIFSLARRKKRACHTFRKGQKSGSETKDPDDVKKEEE